MKDQRVSPKKPTRKELWCCFIGMCAVINEFFPKGKPLTGLQHVLKGQMQLAAWSVAMEGKPQAWRELERIYGPFLVVTARQRGPKKKATLTAKIRAEKAKRGRGSIEAIADELKMSPRAIRYHLYEKRK